MFCLLTFALCTFAETGWWQGRPVSYRVIDGFAVAEGDIILGTAEEFAASSKTTQPESVGRTGTGFLWPGGVIPYVIDDDVPDQARITGAVEHWNNAATPVRLVPRTSETAYVRFVRATSGCSSTVGYSGREQRVNLADSCALGPVIHEIGHVVGLFHEQSRLDRTFYVEVLTANVDKRELGNFAQALIVGEDIGPYDFSSIMHYDVAGFSRNGNPVLRSIPAGIPISQREKLSPGDIDGVRRLYGSVPDATTITTSPLGLDIEVDGVRVATPYTARWAPGTQHTLSAPDPQGQEAVRYVFGRWSDEGAQTHTITASPETTVYSAGFVQQYRMPLGATAGGRLQVTPQPADGWFTNGAEVELRAIPNPGYEFGQWAGYGAFGLHGVSPNPLRIVVMGTEQQYTAAFTARPVTTITSEPPGLKVSVDGKAVVTPHAFVWTPGTTHRVEVAEATQTSGGGTARHIWQNWSNEGDQAQTVTANDKSNTLSARFRTQYNVTRTPALGGTFDITPSGENEFWDAGTVLTLRPSPAAGVRFFNWTGDASGADSPGSLVVDDQKSVGARFAATRQIAAGGIVNAAGFQTGSGIAPGTIVTIFGVDIGPEDLQTLRVNAQGTVETSLGGYSVLFDDAAAPLLYVARNQVSAVAPWSLQGRSQTVVRVAGPGWRSNGFLAPVVGSNPALFTAAASGSGPAAALNQDGTVNTAAIPAARGSVVVLYGTGAGLMEPRVSDGTVMPSSPLSRVTAPVRVRICGADAPVHYAGGAPGLISGVMQINAEVPRDCPSGLVPVVLRVGDSAAPQGAMLYVR